MGLDLPIADAPPFPPPSVSIQAEVHNGRRPIFPSFWQWLHTARTPGISWRYSLVSLDFRSEVHLQALNGVVESQRSCET